MGIKEFAKSISGKEYDYPQFTKEEIKTAKSNGIYIMYAENDSTIKIEGAIKKSFQVKEYCETEDFKNEECEQESGKYLLHFTRHGVMKEKEEQKITWTCEADIPHETFVIYKGGEFYCRGIVFSIDDLI